MEKKIEVSAIDPCVLEIYNTFRGYEGSEQIGNLIALQALFEITKSSLPKRILEVGGGIGTLSYLMLKESGAHIDIFEDHPFCIDALGKNLKEFKERFTILTCYEKYSLSTKTYDLVIIDGGTPEFAGKILGELDDIKEVFVEGKRWQYRKAARKTLSKKYVYDRIAYVDPAKKYKGAYEIVCTPNKNFLSRKIQYLFVEIIYWIKAKTWEILHRQGFLL